MCQWCTAACGYEADYSNSWNRKRTWKKERIREEGEKKELQQAFRLGFPKTFEKKEQNDTRFRFVFEGSVSTYTFIAFGLFKFPFVFFVSWDRQIR